MSQPKGMQNGGSLLFPAFLCLHPLFVTKSCMRAWERGYSKLTRQGCENRDKSKCGYSARDLEHEACHGCCCESDIEQTTLTVAKRE